MNNYPVDRLCGNTKKLAKGMIWFFLTVVIVLPSYTHTRSQDNIFQPIDPKTVFADSIEVVETLPLINFSNETKELYYLSSESKQWQIHPYPDELSTIEATKRRSDGTYLIFTAGWASFLPQAKYTWIFDPHEPRILPGKSICGNYVKDLSGGGTWVLFQDQQSLFHFCFTENGQLTSALPSNLQDGLCDKPADALFSALPSTSPDGQWITFMSCNKKADEFFNYDVYAYELNTHNILKLGQSEASESIYVIRWLNNTTPIFGGDTLGSQHQRFVYTANVTQADSLELIASQCISFPQFYDNPPHYVWVKDSTEVETYDLTTNQSTALLNRGCQYYVEACIAIPNSISTATKKEMKWIAILEYVLQGDSGSLTIYDVNTNSVVFTSETEAMGFGFRDESRPALWLDENTSFWEECSYPTFDQVICVEHSIRFDKGQIIEQAAINNVYPGSPISLNQQYILVWSDPSHSLAVESHNLKTRDIRPLIKALDTDDYNLILEWQEADVLLVTLTYRQNPNLLAGQWLVKAS